MWGKNGADFKDADVALARQIQPMLAVVDRQTQILAASPPGLTPAGLTAREAAVLQLLSQGMTAVRISQRAFRCAPYDRREAARGEWMIEAVGLTKRYDKVAVHGIEATQGLPLLPGFSGSGVVDVAEIVAGLTHREAA